MDDRRNTAVETRRETSSALPFAEQREQVRRFLGELSESTASAEAEIAGIVKQLLDSVASGQRSGAVGSKELAARESQLAAREAQFASLDAQLAARETQLASREAQISEQLKRLEAERSAWEAAAAQGTQRDAASSEALESLRLERKQLADERSRLEHEVEETARLRTRLDERRQRHEQAEEELEAEKRRAKSRRRKMLAEVAEQKEAAEAELKRRELDLQARLESLTTRERKLAETPSVDTSGLEQEVRRLQRELDEYIESYEQCRCENSELRERLEHVAGGDDAAYDELRNRFDESQTELRELQRRHLELERAHESALAAPRPADVGGSQAMDWESQKRRLLAALESECDMNDPKSRSDRLTVEGAIRITDGVVHEKEREIAELKQMLAQQSCNVGEVSIGAAALAGMLDQDDLIREHRDQAETLKKQWEEKLRAAEIEISIERAKLGRDRNELLEKQAELEAQLSRKGSEPAPAVSATNDPKKTGGGRWLARLGLRDKENG